ncbi:MAG: LysM peptidoglycan-binding domain-containing protein [Syntrophobacteraceae bacterium]
MPKAVKLLLIAAFSMMAACCAVNRQANQKTSPEVRMPEYIQHRILPGETLASIAAWYTGQEGDWRELAKSNPSLDPRRLRPGDLVKIPLRIATRHTTPPSHSTAVRKRGKTPARAARPKEIPPPLPGEVFGPR